MDLELNQTGRNDPSTNQHVVAARTEPPDAPQFLDDDEFFRQLKLLRRIRTFLINRGVAAQRDPNLIESPFNLGVLNLLRYKPGHPPATLDDWKRLENKQDLIQQLFDLKLQRDFRLENTRRVLISLPIFLLFYSGLALAIAIFPPRWIMGGFNGPEPTAGWKFFAYLMWTSGLGALGSLGFLAVNSLSIQQDATFDLSDIGLVGLRIVLGALFGSILALPFCFPYFLEFTSHVAALKYQVDKTGQYVVDGARGSLLIVPFLLGFSTSLVMALLNRLIRGVETVFGIDHPGLAPHSGELPGKTRVPPVRE